MPNPVRGMYFALLKQGKSKAEARKMVEAKFGKLKSSSKRSNSRRASKGLGDRSRRTSKELQ